MGRAPTLGLFGGHAWLLLLACSAEGTDLEGGGGGDGPGSGGASSGGAIGQAGSGETGGAGVSGGTGGTAGTGGVGATGAVAGTYNLTQCPDGTPNVTWTGPPGDPKMITDMEITGQEFQPPLTSTGSVTGRWHAFNDGTGSQTPQPNAVFLTALICPYRTENSARAAETWGSGFTDYGAGIGIWVNKPDMNEPLPYDASTFGGISFWTRGTGAGLRMRAVSGSGAEPCTNQTCNRHSVDVAVTPDWQFHSYTWDRLVLERGAGAFNAGQFYGIEWLVPGTDTGNVFDFWIDDVAFL